MSNTPLIRKISKGTMITFASTGEDMNFSFGDNSKKFRFSHFALLDIPPIQTSTSNENTIQLANIESAFENLSVAGPPPEGDKIDISESFQNYLFNIETILTNGENYNRDTFLNPSERLFWKWMKEIGAMRYRNATASEVASGVLNRYTEETDNSSNILGDLYHRTVRYVGEIDMEGSNFSSNRNSFKEVYVYVPSQNGATPTVLFKSVQDINYFPGQTIKQPDNVNIEFIQGQDGTPALTAAGLRVKALYDMDFPLGSFQYVVNGSILNPIWFAPQAVNGPNAYFTDSAFDDPGNDEIVRTNPTSFATISYKRSRLDGISIDFNTDDYADMVGTTRLARNFNEYNNTAAAQSFKFNAVLLYYQVYDPQNPTIKETNLYGVCFLNDLVTISAGASRFDRNSKTRQDNVLNNQGNGFGFKFNFKFDVTGDTVGTEVEVSVNDYNTFSMQLFTETMQKIIAISSKYELVLEENRILQQQVNDLLEIINSTPTATELQTQIDALNKRIDDVVIGTEFLDLLDVERKRIDAILTGQTTVGLTFALDLRPEDGLKLDLISDTLFLRNSRQAYETVRQVNLFTDVNVPNALNNLIPIGKADTLIYHDNGGVSKIAGDDVIIFLKDDPNTWKANQSVKILFKDKIDFNNFSLVLYTDSTNKQQNPQFYQALVGIVDGAQLSEAGKTVEVVCVEPGLFKFLVF